MPNSIELAKKYNPIIDAVYTAESKTAILDRPGIVDLQGVNEAKILKVAVQKLGDYSGSYPQGDVTATWETIKLLYKRSRRFDIAKTDNEETLNMLVGAVLGEFTRSAVVPEVDAIRFAKYATAAGTKVEGALGKSTFKDAIETAQSVLIDKGISLSNTVIFINALKAKDFYDGIGRTLANEMVGNTRVNIWNGAPIIEVPSDRFYSKISTLSGSTGQEEGGYVKAADGKDINFMIVEKSAPWQVIKDTESKMFEPSVNQNSSGYIYDFLMYHDAGLFENKEGGVYVHTIPAESGSAS